MLLFFFFMCITSRVEIRVDRNNFFLGGGAMKGGEIVSEHRCIFFLNKEIDFLGLI